MQSLILSSQLDVEMIKGRKISLGEPAFIFYQDHKGSIICFEGLLARCEIRNSIFITCDLGIIFNSPEMKNWMIRQVSNVKSLMTWNCWRRKSVFSFLYQLFGKVKMPLFNCREILRVKYWLRGRGLTRGVKVQVGLKEENYQYLSERTFTLAQFILSTAQQEASP